MEFTEILGQIFGIIQIILYIISTQFKKRTNMLFAFSALNFASFMNLLLIDAGFTSYLGCAIATVHCFVNAILSIKGHTSGLFENLAWCAVYLISWGVGTAITIKNGDFRPIELLTLVTLIFYFGTVFFLKERNIRLCTIGNSVTFLIYNIYYMNIAAVSQILSIISTTVALIRFREKKEIKNASETTE